ncbi:MAG: hypothetical protein M1355_00305 [Patescibacteria group bacterium]|nr:hypothetical protein [Patescibacteria group bacterium]
MEYKFSFNGGIDLKNDNLKIVAIDLEWAKNWRAVDKTVPFCFTLHAIELPDSNSSDCIRSFKMSAHSLFKKENEKVTDFLVRVDRMIGRFITDKTLVIGHQISSDLHTMRQHSDIELSIVNLLIDKLKLRKVNRELPSVFDTRYDINSRILGQEKLRDVSIRLGIKAIQFELNKGLSLTKLYNNYLKTKDKKLKEKLIVLNWRHAFQTALVYLVDQFCSKSSCKNCIKELITNPIMKEMAMNQISYIDDELYLSSLTEEGINRYVALYSNS